ncbi:hypothetical protein [uncultured Fructobacillus sp.]|uniref:hypothetical protein n=1 Tax=uncultured Fructobacillus sp. TaxID=591942 RepID=UPI0025938F4E|nr:hypothetical protein [uncultured Fructobacillus sp.]
MNKKESNKTNLKKYIIKQWRLISLFVFLIFYFSIFAPNMELLTKILKLTIGNSDNNIFNRHIYIIADISVPLALIAMSVLEFKLIIDYQKLYDDVDKIKPILYLSNAVLIGIPILLFFPWKFISPILTVFTSVLIPIALMNTKTSTNNEGNNMNNIRESKDSNLNDSTEDNNNKKFSPSTWNNIIYWTTLMSVPGMIIPQLWHYKLGTIADYLSTVSATIFILTIFIMLGLKMRPSANKK